MSFLRSNPHFRKIAALLLIALLGSFFLDVFGQTVFLDFNTAGQYSNNFNPWNDVGGSDGGSYSFMEDPFTGDEPAERKLAVRHYALQRRPILPHPGPIGH